MLRLRIATYNVHKCKGLDGRVVPARIAEVLRAVNADVIALQEVLNVKGNGRESYQGRYLAEELGMHFAVGQNRQLKGGAYGNVLLSRFPLETSCNFDLSVRGYERRGCLRCDVEVPDYGPLHLFNVHLGTGFFERRAQGNLLLGPELLRCGDLRGPRVLLGDFNEWTRGVATRLLCSEFQCPDIREHLGIKATYPGVLPVLHLDHIYYDEALRVEAAGLHRTPLSLVASDHLPLWADFSAGA